MKFEKWNHTVDCSYPEGCSCLASAYNELVDHCNVLQFEVDCLVERCERLEVLVGVISENSVEKFINELPWSPSAEDREKTLVAGNIRNFARLAREVLIEKEPKPYCFVASFDDSLCRLTCDNEHCRWNRGTTLAEKEQNK